MAVCGQLVSRASSPSYWATVQEPYLALLTKSQLEKEAEQDPRVGGRREWTLGFEKPVFGNLGEGNTVAVARVPLRHKVSWGELSGPPAHPDLLLLSGSLQLEDLKFPEIKRRKVGDRKDEDKVEFQGLFDMDSDEEDSTLDFERGTPGSLRARQRVEEEEEEDDGGSSGHEDEASSSEGEWLLK